MRLKFIFPFMIAIMAIVSCDKVHEFPEPGAETDPTFIESHFRLELSLSLELSTVISKSSLEYDDEYDRRYIVEIRNGEFNDDVVETSIITREASDTSALFIEANLHARKYKIGIWSDMVLKGSTEDLYYDTGNGTSLGSVHVLSRDKYVAGTDRKDVQTAVADIDLTPYAGEWYVNVVIPVQLSSPMAKITILADDLSEYARNSGAAISLDNLASQLTNAFSYSGYLPTGFNVITGKLNDSDVSYGFKSVGQYPFRFHDVDYTLVGSDYVFVNGESSSVTMAVRITKNDGTFVNAISDIVVPVKRGEETVVILKFYTKDYIPGIGINPDFDGEFNVYV